MRAVFVVLNDIRVEARRETAESGNAPGDQSTQQRAQTALGGSGRWCDRESAVDTERDFTRLAGLSFLVSASQTALVALYGLTRSGFLPAREVVARRPSGEPAQMKSRPELT
jgi:hypothetical protein